MLYKYQNLWKDGRIGKLKDFEVKLHVDPSVQQVIQPQRRIPFHLHQKVEAELDKREKQGIIEPVTGPTPRSVQLLSFLNVTKMMSEYALI